MGWGSFSDFVEHVGQGIESVVEPGLEAPSHVLDAGLDVGDAVVPTLVPKLIDTAAFYGVPVTQSADAAYDADSRATQEKYLAGQRAENQRKLAATIAQLRAKSDAMTHYINPATMQRIDLNPGAPVPAGFIQVRQDAGALPPPSKGGPGGGGGLGVLAVAALALLVLFGGIRYG